MAFKGESIALYLVTAFVSALQASVLVRSLDEMFLHFRVMIDTSPRYTPKLSIGEILTGVAVVVDIL